TRRDEALLQWGVAGRPRAGESVSGDLHAVLPFEGGVLVAVADGLGHGDDAALAARTAGALLAQRPRDSRMAPLQHCHDGLLETRGVVASLASFSKREATMTWIGVGNVEGLLLRADPLASPRSEGLLLRGGVVGGQLPPLGAAVVPVNPGDVLVLATDGIRTEFGVQLAIPDAPQPAADRILAQWGKDSDDALVLVARWRVLPGRRAPPPRTPTTPAR